MSVKFLAFLTSILLAGSLSLIAGVEEDWATIISLDAGPKKKPTTPDEARLLARTHLALQRKTIEDFLKKYPQSSHTFDARKKLAIVWSTEGSFDNSPTLTDKAITLLTELENSNTASPEQRADAAFLRASVQMQNQTGDPASTRDSVVRIARDFATRFPSDRRSPRLLVEAATLCDDTPNLKRELLQKAFSETRDESLKRRIEDDLRRLAMLNKPLTLRFTSTMGSTVDIASLRGNVVVLIFWSAESPHSLLWLRDFLVTYEKMPKEKLKVITVSLDNDRGALTARLRNLPPTWPTYFDAKGWEGPVPRTLGINALPSVWILDKEGVVRSINAKINYEEWISRLSRE